MGEDECDVQLIIRLGASCTCTVYSTEAIEENKRQKAYEAERARRIRQERGEPERDTKDEDSDADSEGSFM